MIYQDMIMIRQILIFFVKLYQHILSPHLGGHCRFYPSCSDYAIQSLTKDGTIKGIFKTTWRVARCNPFGKGGVDYP
jgi:uncharacterized protein